MLNRPPKAGDFLVEWGTAMGTFEEEYFDNFRDAFSLYESKSPTDKSDIGVSFFINTKVLWCEDDEGGYPECIESILLEDNATDHQRKTWDKGDNKIKRQETLV